MTLYLPSGEPARLNAHTLLGAGATGMVYADADHPGICYKVFLAPSAELDRRVDALLRLQPRTSAPGRLVAWPAGALRDESRRTRLLVLPRAYGTSLDAVFDPRLRATALRAPIWPTCVEIALRIARIVAEMHQLNVVIGDLKPDNFIVDPTGAVTLIDCDSVQFTDPWTREQFIARHVTPGYTAPETLAAGSDVLPRMHDLFALAVLICQLLLEGDHPFEGVSASGADPGLDRNVAAGDSRLFFPERFRPAAGLLPVEALPAPLRELAYRGLVGGHARPELRPTATDWAEALDRVLGSLLGCRVNSRHFYPEELGGCLWCAQVTAGGLDHYPDWTPVPVGGDEADQPRPVHRPAERSAPAGRTA